MFRKIALATMHSLGIAPDPSIAATQAAEQADAEAAQAAEAAGGHG